MSSTRPRTAVRVLAALTIVATVVGGFALRLDSVLHEPNLIGTDPVTRVLYAEILRLQGWRALMDTTTWLPLHMWLLGWSGHVIDDPNLAARLPTIVGGSLAAWPAFLLGWRGAHLVAGARTPTAAGALLAGAAAALLAALEPLSNCYGTVSFAAPMAVALSLAGAAALTPLGRPLFLLPGPLTDKRWLFAVPLLAAATVLRYEMWCLVLLIPLCAPARWPARIGATALSLVPGLAWVLPQVFSVLQNSLIHSDVSEAVPAMTEERIAAIHLLVDALVRYGSPSILGLGLIACVVLLARGPASWALPGTILGLTAFLVVLALMGHVPMADRYLTLPLAGLCVAGPALLGGLTGVWRSGRAHVAVLAVAVLATGLQVRAFAGENERWTILGPPGLDPIADTLAFNYAHDPLPVFIDPDGLTALYHYWKAEIPLRHIAGPVGHGAHVHEYEDVISSLRDGSAGSAWLILTDLSPMTDALKVAGVGCLRETLPGATLTCIAEQGRYRLFRVAPRRTATVLGSQDRDDGSPR